MFAKTPLVAWPLKPPEEEEGLGPPGVESKKIGELPPASAASNGVEVVWDQEGITHRNNLIRGRDENHAPGEAAVARIQRLLPGFDLKKWIV